MCTHAHEYRLTLICVVAVRRKTCPHRYLISYREIRPRLWLSRFERVIILIKCYGFNSEDTANGTPGCYKTRDYHPHR